MVGVTMVDEVEQIRPPLVARLEQALAHGRPDLVVVTAGSVRDRLGLAAHRRILSAYQLTGRLSDADGADLDSALEGTARYAILARVEKNTAYTRTQGGVRLGNTGNSYGYIKLAVATRSAEVRVTLYDLRERREVYAVVHASSIDNVPPDSIWRLPRRPVIPDLNEPRDPKFVDPVEIPGLAETLIEGFVAFVAELPR
ncbi:MAG TPA: hypothetical protein VFM17_03255 [Candidatus Eisenbacteria bacterium]|nr:hypothetical protein [Candidatus Eisenbacteria bacterium]